MALARAPPLRALIAFWEGPHRRPVLRVGTTLHGRFMLPHHVREDFLAVVDRPPAARLDRRPGRHLPQLEFRFPVFGEIRRRGIGIALRVALEPWDVPGEEGAIGGTVRYVGSSVEHLQVRMSRLDGGESCGGEGGRHHVAAPVNGLEAEGRRLARFEPMGHTPGDLSPLDALPDPEFPLTLDLRRSG